MRMRWKRLRVDTYVIRYPWIGDERRKAHLEEQALGLHAYGLPVQEVRDALHLL